mmetsp:Transcript_71477/g.231196  ORF Transcript_71477/g.231196 Transcript_71477/m.231196 type:complete len:303 (+) Transcript_71477:628-1536(+)
MSAALSRKSRTSTSSAWHCSRPFSICSAPLPRSSRRETNCSAASSAVPTTTFAAFRALRNVSTKASSSARPAASRSVVRYSSDMVSKLTADVTSSTLSENEARTDKLSMSLFNLATTAFTCASPCKNASSIDDLNATNFSSEADQASHSSFINSHNSWCTFASLPSRTWSRKGWAARSLSALPNFRKCSLTFANVDSRWSATILRPVLCSAVTAVSLSCKVTDLFARSTSRSTSMSALLAATEMDNPTSAFTRPLAPSVLFCNVSTLSRKELACRPTCTAGPQTCWTHMPSVRSKSVRALYA